MIARPAHNADNVHIEFMQPDSICGLYGGYHSEVRTVRSAGGGVVEMTLS
jgi:hypothetical protein